MHFVYVLFIVLSTNILTALCVTWFYAPLLSLGLELQHRKKMERYKADFQRP